MASRHGFFRIVEWLLRVAKDCNNRLDPQPAFYAACAAGHKEIAELLLANGATVFVPPESDDANAERKRGFEQLSPLKLAAQGGHFGICRWLLSKDAPMDIGLHEAAKHKELLFAQQLIMRGVISYLILFDSTMCGNMEHF